jgi:hypothetical protein
MSPDGRPAQLATMHGCKKSTHTLLFLVSKIWSCWHRKMSRPFTHDGETYRVCLKCGMRREFDLEAWKTGHSYYFPRVRPRHLKQVVTQSKLRLIKLKRAS